MKYKTVDTQKTLLILAVALLVMGFIVSSGVFGLSWRFLGSVFHVPGVGFSVAEPVPTQSTKVVSEESVVIDVVDRATPAVVTVNITKTRQVGSIFELDPFDPFLPFRRQQGRGQTEKTEQDIGSGFIVDAD